MKAISLWQPWASAIACGAKRIETRHWATKYRGPLLIHAAKRWDAHQRFFTRNEQAAGRLPADLPRGVIVAACHLVACIPSDDLMADPNAFGLTATDKRYGDYGPGRFGWLLEDVIALPEPIPYLGKQGFFNVPDDILPPDILSTILAKE